MSQGSSSLRTCATLPGPVYTVCLYTCSETSRGVGQTAGLCECVMAQWLFKLHGASGQRVCLHTAACTLPAQQLAQQKSKRCADGPVMSCTKSLPRFQASSADC